MSSTISTVATAATAATTAATTNVDRTGKTGSLGGTSHFSPLRGPPKQEQQRCSAENNKEHLNKKIAHANSKSDYAACGGDYCDADAVDLGKELAERKRPISMDNTDYNRDASPWPHYYDQCEFNDDDGDSDSDADDNGDGAEPQQQSSIFATAIHQLLSPDVGRSTPVSSSEVNDSRVRILGKTYHQIRDYQIRRQDEMNLFWFTYRCDFAELSPYGYTTDAGWGCMLRASQMLLAQALRLHYVGREWMPPPKKPCGSSCNNGDNKDDDEYFRRRVLTWFADFAGAECCFSLHNMVARGLKYEKLPGEWYGPGTACYVLRDLCESRLRYQQEQHQMQLRQLSRSEGKSDTKECDDPLREQHHQQQLKERNRKTTRPGGEELCHEVHEGDQEIFRVFVAGEGCVYKDSVYEAMTQEGRRKREQEERGDDASDSSSSGTACSVDEPVLVHPLQEPSCGENGEGGVCGSWDGIEWDRSLLLLIPLRLGLESFNASSYGPILARTFELSQSVGFIGGRPRHAIWFYGSTMDGLKLLGLDPHTVHVAPEDFRRRQHQEQEQVQRNGASCSGDIAEGYVDYERYHGESNPPPPLSNAYMRSVHCPTPAEVDMSNIDPSLALGFYCKDAPDFEKLCIDLSQIREEECELRKRRRRKKKQSAEGTWNLGSKADDDGDVHELFSIADAAPNYESDVNLWEEMMAVAATAGGGGGDGRDHYDMDEHDDSVDDEYVFL